MTNKNEPQNATKTTPMLDYPKICITHSKGRHDRFREAFFT
jgi:hypothetical protein